MRKILLLGSHGYIASGLDCYLNGRENDGGHRKYRITGIDIGWFSGTDSPLDYRTLTKGYLLNFDVVILLAGHSSVRQCEGDMISSFRNNVVNFVELLDKLEWQKFIYASSSSIYGSMLSGGVDIAEDRNDYVPVNHYDLSKYVIDQYATLSGKKYYGLRFGTVNGFSPRMRTDIMINSMVNSALTVGSIKVFDGNIKRPILGMADLCRAVESIIEREGNPDIYNLASFNSTPLEIGQEVSKLTGCEIVYERLDTANKSKPYDYSMDSSKFAKVYEFEFRETVASITTSLMPRPPVQSSRHYRIEYR